ncbi:hypothetical protein G6F53_013824 [Rhizopus delemar]|nr:hypothetical protein G6F53_013824 [Rhizopus delemar]
MLGVGSVAIEVTAGAIGARLGTNTAFTMNLQLNLRLATFRTAGAVFATAATLVDSTNNALSAMDQYDVHNYEAGGAYATSSAFLLMSGLTSVAAAVIAVGGAFSTAGRRVGTAGYSRVGLDRIGPLPARRRSVL